MMFTADQLQEVTSWMEDEGRCVTIATVSQSLGLSRSDAQALLEQLAEQKQGAFRVSVVSSEKTKSTAGPVAMTVFKLSDQPDGYMYALRTQKESLTTTHERDMDQMREMLRNNQLHNLTVAATDVIAPAEQIIPMMEHNAQSADRPIVSSLDRSKAVVPVKKGTTAESFFQTKKSTAATAAANAKEKVTKVAGTTKEQVKETKTQPKKQEKEKTSKENEKENQAKVGRVDDFVGDEDDSSDDDAMEVDVAPRKKIIRGRKQHKEESAEDDPVIEKEPALPIRGAMDDFATEVKRPTPQTTATTGRRRRKKLVQKTSMDAQGYLHTETQEIWEDIPSDEEDEPIFVPKKPITQQSSSTKKVAMKQGTLMGFFTKK